MIAARRRNLVFARDKNFAKFTRVETGSRHGNIHRRNGARAAKDARVRRRIGQCRRRARKNQFVQTVARRAGGNLRGVFAPRVGELPLRDRRIVHAQLNVLLWARAAQTKFHFIIFVFERQKQTRVFIRRPTQSETRVVLLRAAPRIVKRHARVFGARVKRHRVERGGRRNAI
ncbi:MAG: hypothetical protein HDKAJFGB_03273 [Anaerolineae bacterium]|nr:hypothetical protein [Anaerolineae bacterium]